MKLALFKVFKGEASALSSQAMVDGYCWFTYTDGKFYIDYADPSDDSVHRQVLNAGFADSAGSATYDSDGAEIAANTYFVDIDLASNSIQFLNQSNQAIASIAAGDNITLSAAAGGGISIAATDTTYTFNTTAQSNKIQYKETGANSWTDIPINVSITETDPTVPAWAKESTKPTYTASEVGAAESSHTHGNITNGGDITATAPTIANGDQLVINDDSAGKITNGPTFDGSTTTKYLSKKGTWEDAPTAASIGALTSESDPIFSASAAAGITSSNISTWNGKQDALPSQTNNSGKFLTTNGSALSWGTVDALPSQTNNSGKFLTTNGTSASWATITDNDTKNTAGSTNIGSKIYLIGATSQADNPQTYSNSNLYYHIGLKSIASSQDDESKISQGANSILLQVNDDDSGGMQSLSMTGEGITLKSTGFGLSISEYGETSLTGLVTPTSNDMAANKKYVDDAIAGLGSVLTYKGTKAAISNLPTTGNTAGDVWHITDDGSEYAWDGSNWQELGTVVDLSGYVPTSRTINGKALSSNITLSASDVSALPDSTTIPQGTVTSVRVQASSPLQSSTSIEQTTSLNTTISFSSQNKNLVLAGPSFGSTAAAPTFRSLVADDIPTITKSKISDFPTIDSTPTNGNTNNLVSSDGTYDKILARTKIYTASCSTSASTAAKVATLDDSSGFSLTTGVMVAVRFQYGNSATTPTLRVDGSTTGTAKTIAFSTAYNSRSTGNGSTYNTWGPYETVTFTYDGTYWVNTGSALGIYNAYNKANSITASSLGALTSESDPVFSASAASGISSSDISNWNGKQDALPSQTSNSGKFLTTDGSSLSWGSVSTSFTITANATDGLWDLTGTSGTNAVTYALAPHSEKQSSAAFYTGTTNPTLTTRLNYDGYLYATKYNVAGGVALEYNSTTETLNFVFT